ncbi:MAG: DNA polymerase III subunit delta' [Chromatiales bacterium]|jgi:DNA polymerase-3 subunit delta'|nr:DNA polymerase III subunit delta' [Chromatiales bacterium]MDX9765737.1 DNA polymerase III subunit delta' [Ectothiorhodospiraceae bacterium]
MSALPPWFDPAWQRLRTQRTQDRLPHALLIHGPEGIGERDFVRALAAAALCETPEDGDACGHCDGCVLFRAGNHPDYSEVRPEEEGKQLRIDQIRDLAGFVGLSRGRAPYKVVVLTPADRLNDNAANALLKTLEEPPPRTLLLLLTSRPGRLPATIRSRCQRVPLHAPTPDQARAWLAERLPAGADADVLLALAHGAPQAALALAGGDTLTRRAAFLDDFGSCLDGRLGVVAFAGKWCKEAQATLAAWLNDVLADAIRRASGAPSRLSEQSADGAGLRRLPEALDLQSMFKLLHELQQYRRLLETPVNPQMLLEGLAVSWKSALAAQAPRRNG